jgi:hypothetical protein
VSRGSTSLALPACLLHLTPHHLLHCTHNACIIPGMKLVIRGMCWSALRLCLRVSGCCAPRIALPLRSCRMPSAATSILATSVTVQDLKPATPASLHDHTPWLPTRLMINRQSTRNSRPSWHACVARPAGLQGLGQVAVECDQVDNSKVHAMFQTHNLLTNTQSCAGRHAVWFDWGEKQQAVAGGLQCGVCCPPRRGHGEHTLCNSVFGTLRQITCFQRCKHLALHGPDHKAVRSECGSQWGVQMRP